MDKNFQMNDTTTPAPRLKRTVLIIVCLLVVGAVAAGTIALLRNTSPKTIPNTDTDTAVSAEEIIKAIQVPGAIKSLDGFTQQANLSGANQIVYKSSGRSYAISTPAKGGVLFVAQTHGPGPSNAEEEIIKFITERGYTETETADILPASTKYTTLKSSGGVCQITNPQSRENQQIPTFYQIACADSAAISQEYSNVEKLLSIYKEGGGEVPSFTSATNSTTTEDTKSFSIVTLNGNNVRLSLLFASVDNNWEFIGDLTGDSSPAANGKYSISAEMRSKMNAARYENFLRKYFP